MASETAATHDDIWDDSALVDSWNQALAEYKKYHSIHAKGGTIEDIQSSPVPAPRRNAVPETNVTGEPLSGQEGQEEEGEADENAPMGESNETPNLTISDGQGSGDANKQGDRVQAGGPTLFPPGPQVLLGTVQDEELKKLLMSWYYAGYYTGLYEGKQQGLQHVEPIRKSS
ncbi:hypothetical protein VTK26DRAFT_1660 [Humicola hyalothermophila]